MAQNLEIYGIVLWSFIKLINLQCVFLICPANHSLVLYHFSHKLISFLRANKYTKKNIEILIFQCENILYILFPYLIYLLTLPCQVQRVVPRPELEGGGQQVAPCTGQTAGNTAPQQKTPQQGCVHCYDNIAGLQSRNGRNQRSRLWCVPCTVWQCNVKVLDLCKLTFQHRVKNYKNQVSAKNFS